MNVPGTKDKIILRSTSAPVNHALTKIEDDPEGYGDGLSDYYLCSCDQRFEYSDVEAAFDHGRETAPVPQVYVNVTGGVAEATATRGDVEIIEHDWDNLRFNADYTEEDLRAMREKLARVANSEYRARLLADMDEVIARYEYEVPA